MFYKNAKIFCSDFQFHAGAFEVRDDGTFGAILPDAVPADAIDLQGATVIPGLTEYSKYRCTQLKTNFAHDITDQRAAAKALQYGEYVDWLLYGIEGEENYYTANVREAIGKGNWGGTADEIAYSIANGFRNSKGHWSYVGSSKYTYMAVGVMYDGYYWYVCVCMDSENTDLK